MSDKKDVEISSKGVILKGAYSDLRPAIQGSVKVAETVLSVIDNIVGLPADFLNHHLTTFRQRYRKRLEEIPAERRDVPPLRVGCSVLKGVAFAAEEPEIQEMFADLLGTSSDIDTQHLAHPGFTEVINQLLPLDAKILRHIVKPNQNDLYSIKYFAVENHFNPEGAPEKAPQLRASVDNLVRLGLLEWDFKRVSWSDALRLKQHRSLNRISSFTTDQSLDIRDLKKTVRGIDNSFDRFTEQLSRLLKSVGEKASLKSTEFGRQFVTACLRGNDSKMTSGDGAN